MSKIFQIVNGMCHWQTPFKSLDETVGKFPPDCIFVEAPDYVNEQWGFDETEIGDERFIKPTPPEGFIYDEETGTFMDPAMKESMFKDAQDRKQVENNNLLAEYLKNHPITWSDGKQYGITKDDQNEIMMNLISYQSELAAGNPSPTLEWHAVHEACVPWTYENLTALSIAIREAVYPWYNKNQEYKTQIYAATTNAELNAIELVYEPKTAPEEQPITNPTDPAVDNTTTSNTTDPTTTV